MLVDVVAPLVETINAEGVTIVRGEEETTTRVPATTDPTSVGPVDLVVFFIKCYHTAVAAESARPLVGPDTVVASLQNGWGNGDVLAGVYPQEQIVVGVTYNSGLVQAPGQGRAPRRPADHRGLLRGWTAADDARPARLAEALDGRRARGERRLAGSARDLEEADPQRGDAADRRPDRDERGCADRARSDARARERDGARGGGRRARRSATTSTRRSASTRSTRCSRRRGRQRLRCCRTSRRVGRRRST